VKPPTNTKLYAQQVGCDPSESDRAQRADPAAA
jgi:hypothetical protein